MNEKILLKKEFITILSLLIAMNTDELPPDWANKVTDYFKVELAKYMIRTSIPLEII